MSQIFSVNRVYYRELPFREFTDEFNLKNENAKKAFEEPREEGAEHPLRGPQASSVTFEGRQYVILSQEPSSIPVSGCQRWLRLAAGITLLICTLFIILIIPGLGKATTEWISTGIRGQSCPAYPVVPSDDPRITILRKRLAYQGDFKWLTEEEFIQKSLDIFAMQNHLLKNETAALLVDKLMKSQEQGATPHWLTLLCDQAKDPDNYRISHDLVQRILRNRLARISIEDHLSEIELASIIGMMNVIDPTVDDPIDIPSHPLLAERCAAEFGSSGDLPYCQAPGR